MRYDDASNASSMAADSAPTARPDVEFLPQGDMGPATGNAITGAGTASGASGADQVGDAPARIIEVSGPAGPTAASGDSFQANGQYGVLTMDAQGNFSYVRNDGTPDGVQDVFGYTLADRDGSTSATTLTVNIGRDLTTEALGVAQGVVNLPPGVELSDIRVVGRDLVINMPDGTQMVIPGGAVFVPQLVIGDVEIPATNLAALLVNSEPQPAAGLVPSSGGNFAAPVPPLDPGVPLGDLIPPTELVFTPPEFEEPGQFIDDEPEITITPDGQPAAVNAVDSVDEAGLPTRTGEPEGSGEEAAAGADGDPSEATSGVINIDAEDGIDSVTINGEEVTEVGQVIEGAQGTLTITSINLATGQIGYTYLLTDNTDPGGDGISDLFTVTVTDEDGDTATATLTINIIDDEPIARDDTDAVTLEDPTTEGNVLTGADTTSGAAGRDTEGADGLNGQTNGAIDGVTAVQPGTGTTFDASDAVAQNGAGKVVVGEFGTLIMHVDGSYTYEQTVETETGGVDVFTYQITDGDGDVDTATLTITIPANPDDQPEIIRAEDTLVDEDGLQGANLDGVPLRDGETDSTESATDTGQILVDFFGDAPADLLGAIDFINPSSLNGQLQTPNGTPITFSVNGSGQLVGSAGGTDVIIIEFTAAAPQTGGQVLYTYEVTLLGPVEHPIEGEEDSIDLLGVDFQVTDADGDTASGDFDVTIVDDLPTAVTPPPNPDPEEPPIPIISGAVDEDDLAGGNSDVIDASDDLPDPSPTTVGGGVGSLGALFNAGADSPMQNFGLINDPSGLPVLTANDKPVQYSINVAAGTLTAVADIDGDGTVETGETIFILTVNPNGSWSFQLLGQLDHSEAGTEDNLLLDLSSIVTAEDADGDPATAAPGAFVINVDDDMPRPFDDPDDPNDPVCPDDTVATNQPGTSVLDIPLNLPPVGADQPGKLTFDITNGDPVLDNGDPPQPILSNGQPLFYFINESDPTILEARTSEGADPVFIIDLDPVTGTYDFHLLGDISSETSVVIDNLESIGGGNVDAKAIDVPGTPFDLILSTQPENTINTSQNFIGAATGQSLEDGDVVRVDFVQNAFVTGSGGGAVLNFGEYYAATSYRQDVGGLNPSQFGDFTVRAILVNESGNPADPADGDNVFFGDANDAVLGETTLKLYDAAGVELDIAAYNASNDPGDPDIVVTDNGDGSWNILNLPQGFDFEILSDTPFNAVEVEALPGSDTFKLGVISMTRVESVAVDFTVPIVLTDADGDPVTCDIDVFLTPGVTTGADTATVDDDGLDGANPLGAADIDANADDENTDPADTEAVFVGTLSSGGGSGTFTFSLVAPTDPITIGQETVEITGTGTLLTGTITSGDRTGEDLFTISLDADTGVYTVTLLLNVLHEDTGLNDENGTDLSVGIGFEVTDGDTTSEGAINIVFNDDVPTAGTPGTANLTPVVVDESPIDEDEGGDHDPAGVRIATVDFSGAFGTAVFGADGDGGTTYALSLNGSNLGSGLFALDNTQPDGKGDEIMLVDNGDGTISGMVGIIEYFVISADSNTGEVTFEQKENVWHSVTNDDDDTSYLSAEPGTITLVQTITDGDGDEDSAELDLSDDVFQIEDDGPDGSDEGENPPTTNLQLVVDESPLPSAGDGDNSDSEVFAGAFTGLFNHGTDGPGDVTYSLALSADGADSGLFALDPTDNETGIDALGKGAQIELFVDGATIEGRVGADVYFTISVNSDTGEVTLTRNPAFNLWHDNTSNPDDQEILEAVAGTIKLVATVTDADGDSDTVELDLSSGVFVFEDDGPDADPDTNSVNEGATLTVLEADGVLNNDDFGTDGEGTIVGVSANDDPNVHAAGNVGSGIETSLGTLTLNADGSYTYVAKDGVVPPEGATDIFTYTIRDADGDLSTTTLTITLNNVNRIPEADTPPEVWLDDDSLPGGNPGGTGDRNPDTQFNTGTLTGSGGDGDLDFYFTATQTNLPTGFTAALSGAAPAGEQWLVISQGGTPVIRVELVNESGDYEVVHLAPIDHALDSNTEGEIPLSNAIDDIIVTFTARDSNGDDSAPANLTITVDDDTPEAFESEDVNVEQLGTEEGDLDLAGGQAGDLAGLADNYGADGPGTVRFPTSIHNTDSGLDSGGQSIIYNRVDDHTLEGRVGTNVIFTITLNPATSKYTIDLDGVIDSFTDIIFDDATHDFVGGNETWAGFVPNDQVDGKSGDTPVDDGSDDLLLTPLGSGEAINGNANSAGVTGGHPGQNIGDGEGIRLDFVEDLTGIPTTGDYSDLPERTHDFDQHYLVNGATLTFGDGTTDATVSFKALLVTDPADDPGVADPVTGTGALVSISSMVILYDGEEQIVSFDPNDLSQTVEVGVANGVANRFYTVEWIETGPNTDIYYVEVTGIYDEDVSISTFSNQTYNALEVLHLGPDNSSNDFAITGFAVAAQNTDPVPFSVPVELVDADGDVVAGDSLDITVYAQGDLPAPLTLFASNDNIEQLRTANNTMIMSAALAAAGLATEPLAARGRDHDRGDSKDDRGADADDSASLTVEATTDANSQSSDLLAASAASEAGAESNGASPSNADAAAGDNSVSTEDAPPPAVSALSQGTDAPTQSEGQASQPMMADAVAMPSAEQLEAASKDGGESVEGKEAKPDVGKVLADALNGGENGKDLDALINAVSGQDNAVDGLASHGGNGVSNGDMGAFAILAAAHSEDIMTQLTMHQDAAPAQA